MSAGVGQVITGVAFSTLMLIVLVTVLTFTVSVGVNVTDSVWVLPALSTAPAAGVQTNVPSTPPLTVAFSCVVLSAVPNVMSAGVGQVITGVAFSTLMLIVLVAVLTLAVSVGVNVTDSV